jgi:hypothetical protein
MAFTGPYPTTFSGATNAMVISDTVFSGNVVNSGTIGAGGVSVISSTFQGGSFIDDGAIAGGIRIDSDSEINGVFTALAVQNTSTFTGGITNSGIVARGGDNVISIDTLSLGFSGGLTNIGAISGLIRVLLVPKMPVVLPTAAGSKAKSSRASRVAPSTLSRAFPAASSIAARSRGLPSQQCSSPPRLSPAASATAA